MATTPEGKVKTAIKSVLKDEGVYYFMPRGTLLGRRGVSDFICCVNIVSRISTSGNQTVLDLELHAQCARKVEALNLAGTALCG